MATNKTNGQATATKANNESKNGVNNHYKLEQKVVAAFVMAHTFAEVVRSGLFEAVLYTKTMRSIARKGGCQIQYCEDIKTPAEKVCTGTKSHKDGCVTAIYTDEELHDIYVTFCPVNAFTPQWHYGQLADDFRKEVRRANETAKACEVASLEDEQEIRKQADQWTGISEGDRVWCKHYKTMGTVIEVASAYGDTRYHVSYDKPVRTIDSKGKAMEKQDTKGCPGYLRCGITKNYDQEGEREGTALYYAELLRYGICSGENFVFGPVSVKTTAKRYSMKADKGNGWGVIYEVSISDGLGEATTYTMDIFRAANLLAALYANDKGIDPTLYKASEISDENEAARTHLLVCFKSQEEYERACEHFRTNSDYYADKENDEFRTLFFPEEDCLIDQLESDIDAELCANEFTDYHFESE